MNSALASTLVAMMVAAANAQASINGGQYSRTADYNYVAASDGGSPVQCCAKRGGAGCDSTTDPAVCYGAGSCSGPASGDAGPMTSCTCGLTDLGGNPSVCCADASCSNCEIRSAPPPPGTTPRRYFTNCGSGDAAAGCNHDRSRCQVITWNGNGANRRSTTSTSCFGPRGGEGVSCLGYPNWVLSYGDPDPGQSCVLSQAERSRGTQCTTFYCTPAGQTPNTPKTPGNTCEVPVGCNDGSGACEGSAVGALIMFCICCVMPAGAIAAISYFCCCKDKNNKSQANYGAGGGGGMQQGGTQQGYGQQPQMQNTNGYGAQPMGQPGMATAVAVAQPAVATAVAMPAQPMVVTAVAAPVVATATATATVANPVAVATATAVPA